MCGIFLYTPLFSFRQEKANPLIGPPIFFWRESLCVYQSPGVSSLHPYDRGMVLPLFLRLMIILSQPSVFLLSLLL
jgi:hypothetical protein